MIVPSEFRRYLQDQPTRRRIVAITATLLYATFANLALGSLTSFLAIICVSLGFVVTMLICSWPLRRDMTSPLFKGIFTIVWFSVLAGCLGVLVMAFGIA